MSAIFAQGVRTAMGNRDAAELALRISLPSSVYLRGVGRLLLLASLLSVVLSIPVHAVDAPVRCQDTAITVVGGDQTEIEQVCVAVLSAAPVLARNGIAVDTPVTIRLVSGMPNIVDDHAFGFFDARSNEITLLNFGATSAAAQFGGSVFGLEMTRSLWHSYVAHELAHAAAASRFAAGVTTFTASEYIAAVVQLSVLPEPLRQELLANYDGLEGFDAKTEINSTYYFIDPCAFAVKSYLHYLRPENGPGFIALLLRDGI